MQTVAHWSQQFIPKGANVGPTVTVQHHLERLQIILPGFDVQGSRLAWRSTEIYGDIEGAVGLISRYPSSPFDKLMLLATGGLLGRCAAEVLSMMFPNHQRLTTVDFLRPRHFRRWLFNHINHRFKIWFNSCLIHFGYSKIFKDFILGAHNRHNLLVSQVPSPKSQLSGTLVGQLCHKDFLRLLPQLPCLHNGFRSVTQGQTFSFSKLSRNWIMWI